jgi:plastocyanin
MKVAVCRLGIALLAIAILAGCGGSSAPAQPAGSTKVTMTEFKFDPGTSTPISVKAGTVVFFVVNAGNNTSHDMVIRDSSGKRIDGSSLVSAGDSAVFTINNIAAGTYTIFCDQQGHEASGMKGTLTVTP